MMCIWEFRPLQDLCTNYKQDIVDGPFGSNLKREDYLPSGIPVLKIQNIKPFKIKIKKMDFVSDEKFDELKRHSYKTGDIVMTKLGDPLGASAIVEGIDDGLIVADLVRIRAEKVNTKYLCYHLNSPQTSDFINKKQKGSTRPRVRIADVRGLPIMNPPFAEQQRIVTILDEAFAAIAKVKENAEKNFQNAHDIFESYLHSFFADAKKAGGLLTLADLATDITDGDHMPPPKAASGVPFITIGNIVKDTRRIDFSDTFLVSKAYFDQLKPNKKPKVGDVLYTVTGSFGIPVLISENIDFCFQRHIGLVRPKPDVSSEWLYYVLMSPQVLKQANEGATGTAQKTVSLKLLRSFHVPRIPLSAQKAQAAKLNSIIHETQRLESIYQKKMTDLEELEKSILKKAFSGELTSAESSLPRRARA